MNNELKELCSLNIELYKCITKDIATDKVVLTNKQLIHIAEHHPESYNDVLIELKETILSPDYIIEDKKHRDTGLVVRKIYSDKKSTRHSFLILKICTDTENDELANSIISGWVISEKRLNSYLRNNTILYKKEQSC